MSRVAVIAHSGKRLGGGLPELRRALERRGVRDPLWYEVKKSRQAPKHCRQALERGADVIFVWGGDGMVQRCADVLAGSGAAVAILPAGTANLLASNLGVPRAISSAVDVGLFGTRRTLDMGRLNGERFAVMAGAGFDALLLHDAKGQMKRVLGRFAYVWSALRNLRAKQFEAEIDVDGQAWYRGKASCVLFGNVGRAFAGIEAFDHARPDDGLLDVGVTSARGIFQWSRTVARSALGNASRSPFVRTTKGRSVDVRLSHKVLYELDGGVRQKRKRYRIEIEPAALSVCVPGKAA